MLVLLEAIYDLFTENGAWPEFAHVDRRLDSGGNGDAWQVLQKTHPSLVGGVDLGSIVEPSNRQEVWLTIEGLAAVPAAKEDVEVFARTVKTAALMATDGDPTGVTIQGLELVKLTGNMPVARRDMLTHRLGPIWGKSGLTINHSSGPMWTITVTSRQLRPYRNVESSSDLLDVLHQRASPELPPSTTAVDSDSEGWTGHSGIRYRMWPSQPIGQGGFGVVFAAADAAGRSLALKYVPFVGDAPTVLGFDAAQKQREVQISDVFAAAKAEHLVDLVDYRVDADALWLLMPRADESLDDVLAGSGLLDIDTAWNLFEDLAHALVDLDRLRVVHRDIKPGNVLRFGDRWKLADFGLSRDQNQPTASATVAGGGTWEYWAPELWEDPALTSFATDQYALAITIGHAVSDVPVFTGATPLVNRRQVPDLRGVPDARMRTLLAQMLNRNPAYRFRGANELLLAVQRNKARALGNYVPNASDTDRDSLYRTHGLKSIREAALAADRRVADAEEAAQLEEQLRQDARAAFALIWNEVIDIIEENLDQADPHQDGDAHWVNVYDRRLAVRLADAEHPNSAVMVGAVEVWEEGNGDFSRVANVVAFRVPDDAIRWEFWRCASNSGATEPAQVNAALSDGQYGSIPTNYLDEILVRIRQHPASAPVDVRSSQLTAGTLIDALIRESDAFTKQAANRAGP